MQNFTIDFYKIIIFGQNRLKWKSEAMKITNVICLLQPFLLESLVVVDISPFGVSPAMRDLPKLFNIISSLEIDPFLSVSEARKLAATQLKDREVVRRTSCRICLYTQYI